MTRPWGQKRRDGKKQLKEKLTKERMTPETQRNTPVRGGGDKSPNLLTKESPHLIKDIHNRKPAEKRRLCHGRAGYKFPLAGRHIPNPGEGQERFDLLG